MIVVVAVLIGAIFYSVLLTGNTAAVGFDSTKLRSPLAINAPPVDNTIPTPTSSSTPLYKQISLNWTITQDIYAGYGGAMDLTVKNNNVAKLYIYAFGLRWISSGDTYYRNCSVTIQSNNAANLGLLIFGAPGSGLNDYEILLKVAAYNGIGADKGWHDYGELQSEPETTTVSPLGSAWEVEQSSNPLAYYNKVNQRVSYSDAQTVANLIKAEQPGNYSILQIAETYRWVRANIEYLIDANGDYWQSAKETLSLGTGDCEDHAILMASIIGALGGNARVNLIDQHAFATVYVASGYSGLMKVKQALASYYGIDNQTYEMAYLVDQYGYWLVVDTTGFPYAGGIPANSEAVSLTGNWTVLSTYLYKVDATGVTSSNGFFGLF